MGKYTEQQELDLLDELIDIKSKLRTMINAKMNSAYDPDDPRRREWLTENDEFKKYLTIINNYLDRGNIKEEYEVTIPIILEVFNTFMQTENIFAHNIDDEVIVSLFENLVPILEATLPISWELAPPIKPSNPSLDIYSFIID